MSKKPSRLTRALLETADDMREGGLLDKAAYEKITLRHLGTKETPQADPIRANLRVGGGEVQEHDKR